MSSTKASSSYGFLSFSFQVFCKCLPTRCFCFLTPSLKGLKKPLGAPAQSQAYRNCLLPGLLRREAGSLPTVACRDPVTGKGFFVMLLVPLLNTTVTASFL